MGSSKLAGWWEAGDQEPVSTAPTVPSLSQSETLQTWFVEQFSPFFSS